VGIKTWESFRTPKISEFHFRGQNTSYWGVFISLKSYQSIDVENGLAWAIWTFTTHIMAKRRVESEIGNLTPDH